MGIDINASLVGQNLGPYRIVEQIGKGGMAMVYKAYEPALDRYVAIKVLPHYFAHDPDFYARFDREAKAVARLDHPNILPIYSFGQEGGLSYIAMRYVSEGTLKERLGEPRSLESRWPPLGRHLWRRRVGRGACVRPRGRRSGAAGAGRTALDVALRSLAALGRGVGPFFFPRFRCDALTRQARRTSTYGRKILRLYPIRFTAINVRFRSRIRSSTPCSAAWSSIGPERRVSSDSV